MTNHRSGLKTASSNIFLRTRLNGIINQNNTLSVEEIDKFQAPDALG